MLDELARAQAGVISRSQALQAGMTYSAIVAQIDAQRWRRVLRGVYAVSTGPLTRLSALWAVVLRMGPGAMLSHETAAELQGLLDKPAAKIHVTVPHGRTPYPLRGVVIHRCVRADDVRHPTRLPPQTTVEETVLDLAHAARDCDAADGWLAASVGARLTTTERLAQAMARRPRLRWRRTLRRTLKDVALGCHSVLELMYLRDVERAHGLPRGERQVRRYETGRTQYDDVRYREYGTVVELDGRPAHANKFRDMARDNETVVDGRAPLRYGYDDVRHRPCATAVQVGTVLTRRGWAGRLRRCRRRDCIVP